MLQNGPFVPTVLMQGEIELVVYVKYIIMRIFNDIICMTVLPWQHQFKIFCICHLQKLTRLMLNLCANFQIRDFCILYNLSCKKVESLHETHYRPSQYAPGGVVGKGRSSGDSD